jgi:hypothetical protein
MEAPTIGIGRLLKEGGRFLVPHHQRDFSWTEDEIEQLFRDIESAREDGQPEYFIGLMVFMPEGDREFTILDGQQRLATTILILAAIRSWLRARDFHEDAHQIQSNYVAARELGRRELHPILILNENNNSTFAGHVVRESPIEEIERKLEELRRYDPNRRLLEAALYCRNKIGEMGAAGDAQRGAEILFDFVRYLENNVKIVRLNVPNEANAYTVFETLNDRGLDLSVLDLVKNYLFGKAASRIQLRDIQARWAQMMANLVNLRADDFLKAWWTSRHGRVQTPQLFARFRNHVSTSEVAATVSSDMLDASEQYSAFGVADDPLWSDFSHPTRDSIRALKMLGAQQVHPVLLSALGRLENREIERLLRLLEVMIVRYQLIGGGRTGRLEINCARLAHRIYQGDCPTATEAATLLRDVFPGDDEFRESFRTKQERNTQKARYLLAKLERQARLSRGEQMGEELEPIDSLTLEHVFPKSPGSYWEPLQERDQTLAEDCTYRLGNLCLLTGVNRSLGNRSFEEKRQAYTRSALLLTHELMEFEEWNREAIERRQAAMARLAVAVWRFG